MTKMKRSKGWCDICRDEEPDLFCSTRGCRRKFHIDCLRNMGQLASIDDLEDFMCHVCQAEEDEPECYKCHKIKEGATLLICDECNRGAHLECVGLKEEPIGDEWACPICKPDMKVLKSTMVNASGGRPKLGNVDICYVCQKGGKLLCCDLCDQSFHPKCIDPEFLELTLRDDEDKWGCPICRGRDPLKNMGHKRMTKAERQKRSAEWQKCVRFQSKKCRANRDRFLWECRTALKPFVTAEVLQRIKKSAMAAKASEKVEQKKEQKKEKEVTIPKKRPPVPSTDRAPFRRTTSNSLKAAFSMDETVKTERQFRRLRKTGHTSPSSSMGSDEGRSQSYSRSYGSEDEGRMTGCQRSRTESESEETRESGSSRQKRRRILDDSDNEMHLKLEDTIESGEEGHTNDERKSISKVESEATLKEEPPRILQMELSPREATSPHVIIDLNEFQMSPISEQRTVQTTTSDDQIMKSEQRGVTLESNIESTQLTSISTATASNPTLAEPVEYETLAVSYQRDDLLCEAEEKAITKSLELIKEGVILKNYQRWGVNWLLDAFEKKAGAILADEMGLGKTIQTLTFLSALRCRGITGPHLVVVPLSTVGNWAREIRRFTPQLTFIKICGSRQEREHSMSDGVAMDGIYDIFITTYETCVTEEWFFTDGFKWQCVVLDEAHRIKNESARIRHSLDRVDCNMRVLLTGTPLQNNIKELFTLLNFLFPDVINSSATIEEAFQYKKHQRSLLNEGMAPTTDRDELLDDPASFDESKVDAITRLLSKLMLRRTKDLVVRLPKKIEHDIWLPLSPFAASWYKYLLEITADVDQQSSIRKLLGAVIKMRICCCHPRGLVSREAQLQNFLEGIHALPWPAEKYQEVVEESKRLKEHNQGWDHVVFSSKLIFLDKLLRQLHNENVRYCPGYKKEYLYTRSNQLRKALQERNEKIATLLSESTSNSKKATSERKLNHNGDRLHETGNKNESGLATLQTLKREIELLEKLEDQGGGLDALQGPNVLAYGPPALNSDLFVKYLYPWDPKHDKESDGTLLTKQRSVEGLEQLKAEKNETPTMGEIGKYGSTAMPSPQGTFTDSVEGEEGKQRPPRPHKVLIFTQFQLVLAELEAYCLWRGWSYMRLDGSTNKMIRELDTREFNNGDSNHFIYLISTRAGGLGINLVTANHVVLFDEDWNPFVDLQAIDRAHRIGQTRNVLVWKLMTEWSVEERMAVRRQQKLKLDKLLIQANVENLEELADSGELGTSDEKLSTEEIRRLLQYGRKALMVKQQYQLVMSFDQGVETYTLEDLINRKRRELKELEGDQNKIGLDETPSILQSSITSSPFEDNSDVQSAISEIQRHRRNSISMKEALHEGNDFEESQSSLFVDLEAEDEEPDLLQARKTTDDESSKIDASLSPDLIDVDMTSTELVLEEEDGRALRPKRERKRPKLLYNPLSWSEKSKVERKLIRERHCFRCGDIGTPVVEASSKSDKASRDKKKEKEEKYDSNSNALVGCLRCPKVYHLRNCLGLEKIPPRSWMCPWHECCVCFRRSAAAGGLLIHCAECPTAFCFDCFPPEYSRYVPPPQFYERLQKRGWLVTPHKLVTFLCSRCKAFQEQERRRKLTKQQLEAETKSRRQREDSAKFEAREKQKAARGQKQKEADEKKQFMESKKRIDEADRITEDRLKNAVEELYYERYLDVLAQRRQLLVEQHEANLKQLETSPGDVSGDEEARAETTKKKSAAPKKRLIIPDRLKRPADTLKLCENCGLPRHTLSQCPFPLEFIKQKIEPHEVIGLRPGPKPKSRTSDIIKTISDVTTIESGGVNNGSDSGISRDQTLKEENAKDESAKDESALDESALDESALDENAIDDAMLDGSDNEIRRIYKSPSAKNREETPAAAEINATAPKHSRMTKPKTRTVCALCHHPTKQHSRKHCDQLTDENKQEYANRREKINKFIDLLEIERNSVRTPGRMLEVMDEENFDPSSLTDRLLDNMRRQMGQIAENKINRVLKEANLEECIFSGQTSADDSIGTKIPRDIREGERTSKEHEKNMSSVNHTITKFLSSTDRNRTLPTPQRGQKLELPSPFETSDTSSDSVVILNNSKQCSNDHDATKISSQIRKKRKGVEIEGRQYEGGYPVKKSRISPNRHPLYEDIALTSSSSKEPSAVESTSSSFPSVHKVVSLPSNSNSNMCTAPNKSPLKHASELIGISSRNSTFISQEDVIIQTLKALSAQNQQCQPASSNVNFSSFPSVSREHGPGGVVNHISPSLAPTQPLPSPIISSSLSFPAAFPAVSSESKNGLSRYLSHETCLLPTSASVSAKSIANHVDCIDIDSDSQSTIQS